MTTKGVSTLAVWLLAFLVLGGGASAVGAPQGQPEALTRGPIQAEFLQVPLIFEVNRGQTAAQVKYLSRGPCHTLFLTPGEAVLVLRRDQQARRDHRTQHAGTVLRLRLVGANPAPQVEGLEPLPGKANYFIGNDPTKWRTNIPTYTKVNYQAVYPGVDLVYYGANQRQLEYDFVVAPGADPKAIRLAFSGVDRLSLDAHGDLILHAAGGEVLQRAPRVYQEMNGVRQAVAAGYVLHGTDQVGFRVARYDATRPLVIDPVLSYATYLGGSGEDVGLGIAVDALGNAYVTGPTDSINFPTTPGAFQPAYGGSSHDAFVTKLDPTQVGAVSLVYSTYLGGSGDDQSTGIAVDALGNAYVAGSTTSINFPTTPGAFQPAYGGGNRDVFVTKLNSAGSALAYSTYLGGTNQDEGLGIAVDSSFQAYVTGEANSPNFPLASAFQPVSGGGFDAYVTKLNSAGSMLIYSTFLGGSTLDQGLGIAVDAADNAYVTGRTTSINFPTTPGAFQSAFGGIFDAFVAKIDSNGFKLYATYLGGSTLDQGLGIAVDATGNAYVAGVTTSINFPTTPGAFQPAYGGGNRDAFVTKLNPAGSTLAYSTFLGGNGSDEGHGIAVDATGNAYVTGLTTSSLTALLPFPTLSALPQDSTNGINVGAGAGGDAFVTKLNPAGAVLVYSTFLGGSGFDQGDGIAVDATGNAYVTGATGSPSFPTMNALQSAFGGGFIFGDAFVAKLGAVSGTFSVTVTLAGSGTGTVTSSGVISCPGVCLETFTSGTGVTLTAAPTGGSTFSWGGDCATFGTALTCTLTMDASKSVTATFSSGGGPGGGGGDAPGCNMVGRVHGNQNFKATVSGKTVNVHVEADGDCDYDKKTDMIFLHHAKVHVVVGGGPPLINAKQNDNGKHSDVKSVTLSPGPPPAIGTPTAIVEGIYDAIPFKVILTDGGKGNKDDTVVVMMPVLPAPITGSTPHNNVHIDFK